VSRQNVAIVALTKNGQKTLAMRDYGQKGTTFEHYSSTITAI